MKKDRDQPKVPDVSTEALTRRELAKRLAFVTAALAGTAGLSVISGDASAQVGEAEKEELCKVLIERLLNTKYEIDEFGNLTVLPGDEVWPGVNGGAYHHEWLFHPTRGLKSDPKDALEKTIDARYEHFGIGKGHNLSAVQEILDKASDLRLLDEINLIYHVLSEKIHVETHGAHDKGVEMFEDWVSDRTDIDASAKVAIASAIEEYLNRPIVHESHAWY